MGLAGEPGQRERFGVLLRLQPSGLDGRYHESAGAYVNQYSYDPFGQVTTISAGIANPFTFVGQDGVSSDGNGLIYMRARYYDPSTGQFVSNDPMGLCGGDTNVRRHDAIEASIRAGPSAIRRQFC